MPADSFALSFKNVTISFADSNKAADDFTLDVPTGGKVVLSGPSGSGKTTLLKAALGLVPLTSGKILIEGRELDAQSIWRLRTVVGYCPQEPDFGHGYSDRPLTVEEVLKKPFTFKSLFGKTFDYAGAVGLCQGLGLPETIISKRVDTLSGGQKQRAALLSVLLLNRPIVLLDEVTSALDRESSRLVAELVFNIKGLTVLASSHDEYFSARADEVIWLKQGRIDGKVG